MSYQVTGDSHLYEMRNKLNRQMRISRRRRIFRKISLAIGLIAVGWFIARVLGA